jgi:hypothetical protein
MENTPGIREKHTAQKFIQIEGLEDDDDGDMN